jgi:hypothetical protein
MAFVMLNRFLDLADALEDPDAHMSQLENADFADTDVPFDVPLPGAPYATEAAREEVRVCAFMHLVRLQSVYTACVFAVIIKHGMEIVCWCMTVIVLISCALYLVVSTNRPAVVRDKCVCSVAGAQLRARDLHGSASGAEPQHTTL